MCTSAHLCTCVWLCQRVRLCLFCTLPIGRHTCEMDASNLATCMGINFTRLPDPADLVVGGKAPGLAEVCDILTLYLSNALLKQSRLSRNDLEATTLSLSKRISKRTLLLSHNDLFPLLFRGGGIGEECSSVLLKLLCTCSL